MSHIHHTSHMSPHNMSHMSHMSPVHHHMSPVHHMMTQEDTTPYITIGFVVLSIIIGIIAVLLGGLAMSGYISYQNDSISGKALKKDNVSFANIEGVDLDLDGDLDINSKFTVKSSSGDTAIIGALNVNDLVVSNTGFNTGSGKFTVADSTGNTTIDGTLGVGGISDFQSDFLVNTDKFTVASATGNTAIAGTLDVTGITKIGSRIFQTGNIGTIPDGTAPTITADLMLDNTLLNYASGATVTGAVWDTGANIDTKLTAKGITLATGLFFDVNIQNSDGSVFTFGTLSAGITSGSGAATNSGSAIPVVGATPQSSVGIFRFYRTGAGAYTVYCLSMAAS